MKVFKKKQILFGLSSFRKFSGCSSCVGGCKTSSKLLNESLPPNQIGGSGTKGKSFDASSFLKGANEVTKTTNRNNISWKNANYYDKESLEKEMRRVFEICHGCRLCFNLCDSFPTLFDLLDKSKSGDLDTVPSTQFKSVVDKCTLCDLCGPVKCPYVPPHPFNLDFPQLMLRYRAIENQEKNITAQQISQQKSKENEPEQPQHTGGTTYGKHVAEGVSRELTLQKRGFFHTLIADTDKVGPLATRFAPIVNWINKTGEKPRFIRKMMESILGVHHRADLPVYVPSSETFMKKSAKIVPETNKNGPSFGKRKVIIYATCLSNYHKPDIGHAARAVLANNGVHTEIIYPQCCGMPQLEEGNIKKVSESAKNISSQLIKFIDDGYDVITLISSCSLMFKHEWPSILPGDPNIKKLASKTFDISEYIIDISRKEGMAKGIKSINQSITLHHACHARALNVGAKSRDMLRLIPGVKVSFVEKCSGHGGSFGVMKETFSAGMKVGNNVFTRVKKEVEKDNAILATECPLAGDHIKQGIRELNAGKTNKDINPKHPIELMAEAYGLIPKTSL